MNWYAIQTRSRHEKMVACQLQGQGIVAFLPLVSHLRRWSDRQKLVEFPLFPGYVFVRLVGGPEERIRALHSEGVVGFVGNRGQGTPIPEKQINDIQAVVNSKLPFGSHPYLKVGQRVRVRGGSLDGTEGILMKQNSERTLMVSVDLIQRSLCVRLEGYDLEPA